MKQLTDTEKQKLAAKIKDEQKRQQTLREMNPDLPESFEATSAKTRIVRRIALRHLWKYIFLGIILCLLAFNVYKFLMWRDFFSNKIINLNVLIALTLLFNHIAFNFTKTGRKSHVMKMVALAWIVVVSIYIYISWVA